MGIWKPDVFGCQKVQNRAIMECKRFWLFELNHLSIFKKSGYWLFPDFEWSVYRYRSPLQWANNGQVSLFRSWNMIMTWLQWGSESRTFENKKHSKTGLLDNHCLNGGTIRKPDNLSSYHMVSSKMIYHVVFRSHLVFIIWNPE